MNQWWLLFCVALLGGTFYLGYHNGADSVKVACDKHDAQQQQQTIQAEKHVTSQIQTQGNITNEEVYALIKDAHSIDGLYTSAGLPAIARTTGDSVRPLPSATRGVQTSKKFKLTPKQCDEEEAKLQHCWSWANHQAAIK